MPEINFFLTHKKVEGRVIKKPRPVYAFVYHSPGKRTAYPTGLTILEKHWDKKRQRAKSKAPGANAINRRLNEWHDNILNILSDLNIELAGRPVHERKAYLKRRLNILSGREIPVSLALTGFINTYCKERADMLKKAGRGGHSAYTALAFRWGEYLKENYSSNRTSLPEFSDLNRTLLSNFAKWLLEQHPKRSNGKGQGYTFDTSKTLSRTSVEQILIKMKRVVRVAVDRELDAGRELHINKAFDRASAKDVLDDIGAAYAPIKEGVYLTFGEIRQLYEFDLSGWAEGYRSIRDAFVAACLHGLRKHAWEQVSTKAIQFEIDGVSFQLVNLQGRDNSKKQTALVPHYGYIKEILTRWGGSMPTKGLKSHRYINKVAEAAGLNRTVQVGANETKKLFEVLKLHSSRDSFISNCRALRMPDEYSKRITTHQGTSVTDGYDKRQLEKVAEPLVSYLKNMQASIERSEEEPIRMRKVS